MADIELVIKIPEETYRRIQGLVSVDYFEHDICGFSMRRIADGTLLPKGHGRRFEEIVAEYLPDKICTYPEYRGKPYFSIKYEENGEHIIGYGTYKPEVLSSYLREYFIAPTIIEADKEAEKC